MTYPTVPEIETKLTALAADIKFKKFCSRVPLGPSRNAAATSYVKIANGSGSGRPGVLLIAGVHAREWAPPAAVLEFIELLLNAYVDKKDLPIGGYTAPKEKIQAIVDKLDLYIAPIINPDGYTFSRNHAGDPVQSMWRKNRAPAPASLPGGCLAADAIGVDLNRNFDIVWDFEKFYSKSAIASGDMRSSKVPCDPEFYIGEKAFSEPETINVKTLLDKDVQFFVDVHMIGGTILHSWGIESNGTDPAMRFNNPAFDRKSDGTGGRDGPHHPAYSEFLHPSVLSEITLIAGRMAAAIKKATSAVYLPQPSWMLYAMSGASDDYAFSRHIVDPSKPLTVAYTIECGSKAEGRFFPDFVTQYPKIAKEVQAALLALLTYAADWTPPAPPPPTPPPPKPIYDPPLTRDCVIATAVYGGRQDPAVLFLRRLRDHELAGSRIGTIARWVLNGLYYSFSPSLARYLSTRAAARRAVRAVVLDPIVSGLRPLDRLVSRLPSRAARSAVWVGLFGLGLTALLVATALALAALLSPLLAASR